MIGDLHYLHFLGYLEIMRNVARGFASLTQSLKMEVPEKKVHQTKVYPAAMILLLLHIGCRSYSEMLAVEYSAVWERAQR